MPRPELTVQLTSNGPNGLVLRNPVMLAAGTFGRDGYGAGLPTGLNFQGLGAIVAKTTFLAPRAGNPPPRISHGPGWTLNSIGLQNPGIEVILKEYAPKWASWDVPVILSIAGERVEEFAILAAMIDGVPGISGVELNVSCPNVVGGLEFGQSPQLAEEVTSVVRKATSMPVLVKLSPNVTDLVSIAVAAVKGGADALTLTNTLIGMAIDLPLGKPTLGAITGGVSGPALKPVALAMVYRTYRKVDVPIIGVGGITKTQDALEFMAAGAQAVQIGTAAYADPWAPLEILKGIEEFFVNHRMSSVGQLIAAAHRGANDLANPMII
jgi:dihydroorotate dehydrogenase (NAD+) catalytic subunit